MPGLRLEGRSSPPAKSAGPFNPMRDSFMQLRQAEGLRQRGKLDQAQAICETLARRYPDYFAALHTLGLIHADKGDNQQALNWLVRATMLDPRSWTTLAALSGVYLRLGANEMAVQTFELARLIKPHDANVLLTIGDVYREGREYELARDAYHEAVTLQSNLVPAALGLARCYEHLGKYAEAAAILEGLIKRGLRIIEPVSDLAGLPAPVVSIDLLKQLDTVVRDPSEDKAEFEIRAAFARAKALDKAGRSAEAWELLVPANRKLLPSMKEDLHSQTERQLLSLASLRTNPGKSRGGSGGAGEQTISLFVLGASRSGKTTMEKLMAALDGVKRGCENPIFENALRLAFQRAALLTSSLWENLPPELHPLCRDIYLEELARRAGSARVFTNTHPGRIHDAAFVAEMIPNVRFIFVKRNVEDNVLRIYMRRYDRGNSYAYNINAARDYVVWYHEMANLMSEKFPKIVRVIHYEDMVADPAAALRVAADLCGLAMPTGPLPELGDDRGCAEPYRHLMAAEFAC